MSKSLVSVIIPAYNAAKYLQGCVESVRSQTRSRIELIIVDDCSSDDTWQICHQFELEGAKCIRNEQNRGACYSRNRGAELAHGSYLLFLDADDQIDPNLVRSLATALDESRAEIAAAPWMFLVKEGDDWISRPSGFPSEPPNNDYLLGWLSGWFIPCCSIMWERKSFESLGGWNEILVANQDGELILRALLQGFEITRVNTGCSFYRKHFAKGMTLSHTISPASIESRYRVFDWVGSELERRGSLNRYSIALGRSFYDLARAAYPVVPEIARRCEARAWNLAGREAVEGSAPHRIVSGIIGLEAKEKLAPRWRRYAERVFRLSKPRYE